MLPFYMEEDKKCMPLPSPHRGNLMWWKAKDLKSENLVFKFTQPFIGHNLFLFFFFFFFLGPHLQQIEVPRLEGELEVQLPAYTTATAMWDPNCICNLHHSSWQHWILNPLSEAMDCTHILIDTSRIHYH